MKKTFLSLASVGLALGFLSAMPGQANAQSAGGHRVMASDNHARREPTTCTHFIASDDGGQAFSLQPGAKIEAGAALWQVPVSQAWQFCYPLSASGSHLLRLKADQSYCVSGYKHLARIYKCSVNSANQLWTWRLHRSPFYHRFLNRNGAMCVSNGNDSSDTVDKTCAGKATHWYTG